MMNRWKQSVIAKNASWIIMSRIIQSMISFFINIFTARYLGPSNYGLISYAASLVSFLLPIVFLGLNNTLVYELTRPDANDGEIMGTAIILSFLSSLFCFIGIMAFSLVINRDDNETNMVVLLYSISLVLHIGDLFKYWYQAKMLSKYSSIVSIAAYTVVAIYKAISLITGKNVYWFAITNSLEYLLVSLLLYILYTNLNGTKLSTSRDRAKKMVNRSKHYILSGLMIAIFAQTDKIMLKEMIGESATGCYTAAVSIASAASFVYSAIIDSFRPEIMKNKNTDQRFELSMKSLYSIIIYLSLFQSIIMSIFAPKFVDILYGEQYTASVSPLRIVVWYVAFSYMGSIRNIWIISKDRQRYLWILNLGGAVLNVILNTMLIPDYGINGAAMATLLTQFFANFIMGFIIKPIRENNKILVSALNPKYLWDLGRKWVN